MTRRNLTRILGLTAVFAALALSIVTTASAQRARDMVTRYDVRTVFAGTPGIDSLEIPVEMIRERPAGGAGITTVYNGTAAAIARDRVVYPSGVQTLGTGERVPSVTLATNTGATAERTRGQFVTLEAIATLTTGLAATSALSANPGPIDLAAATQGDPIYLGLTGLPTLTQPVGAFMTQEVGTAAVIASDQIAWNLAQSEAEAHTHVDQSQGSQLALSAAGTVASITGDGPGRALFADDFWDATAVSTAGVGGKFAANALTTAGIVNLFADDAWTAVEVSTAGAGGKFAANALTTAGLANLVADDAFTATELSTAGVGGKFAANALTTAGLANLVADDAFSAVEVSTAGVGGKFAANALTTAGITNLFADDSWTATEFAVGAGGKFAPNALVAAGITNLIAADAFTNANLLQVIQDGAFTDAAATRLLFAEGIWDPDHIGIPIRNNSGAGFNIGDLVAINGWDEANNIFTIGLADNDAAVLRAPLYVLRAALATATSGRAYRTHRLTAVNTAAGVAGSSVYVSAVGTTTNTWTLTAPTAVNSRSISAGRVAVSDAAVGVIEFNLADPQQLVIGNLDLQPGIVSADATGRALLTDDVFSATEFVAGAGGKFAPNALATAGIANIFADDSWTTAEFVAGAGGKFAAGALNNAGLANLVADDAFTATEFGAGVGGKFGANALVTAGIANLFGDDSWTTTEFVAGAGGKFAAGALNNAGVANLVADDAFTATEFGAGVGGKFAANALVTAGIANLFADDSWSAVEVSTAGVGGKFAANALTAAGVTNLIAADAFTAANVLQVIQDGAYAADAATRALFGAGIWTAAELATSSVATAEILDNTVAPVDLGNGTSTLDTNVDTPVAHLSRTFNSASDAAQDVTIYSASSPAMEIFDVWLDPDVAEGGVLTVTLRDATGGLGNAISSALDCNVTTIGRTTTIASNSLAANSTLVMRFSAAVAAAGGTLHIDYRRR